MRLQYNHNLKDFSRQLRNSSTIGEVLLWNQIKARKLGFPFMRQKPVGRFIVDFYCSPLRLAVEIDGSSHDSKVEKDIARQREMEKLGLIFLRFSEREVRRNLEAVVGEIRKIMQDCTTPRSDENRSRPLC